MQEFFQFFFRSSSLGFNVPQPCWEIFSRLCPWVVFKGIFSLVFNRVPLRWMQENDSRIRKRITCSFTGLASQFNGIRGITKMLEKNKNKADQEKKSRKNKKQVGLGTLSPFEGVEKYLCILYLYI